jgi:rhodanese-related sulfurtransferase
VDAQYTPREVAQLLAQTDMQIVDVRQPHEWEAGRIAGARHLELSELASRAGELDPRRPLVFYCRSGARSAMATQAFRQAGFDAFNLRGGLLDWEAEDLPLEPDGGYVANH